MENTLVELAQLFIDVCSFLPIMIFSHALFSDGNVS